MRLKGFIGPAYTLNSVNADCQATVNLYPEINEIGTGKEGEVAALRSTPGLTKLCDVGTGPIRCVHVNPDGKILVASGNKLYHVTYSGSSWSATSVGTGTFSTSTGRIIARSAKGTGPLGLSITVLVDGTSKYLYDADPSTTSPLLGTLVDFASAGLALGVPDATFVEWIDGYFIYNAVDSEQFYVSGWASLTVDPLSFASAEGNPDDILSIIASQRDLIMLGERSCEIFADTGNPEFPFERVQGGFIEKGCAAPYSVAKIDTVVFWLGRDESGQGVVYAAAGLRPERVSTHAIETAIKGYADITTASAFTYQSGGHSYYVLNFSEATWVYDLATKMWHQRAYTNAGILERHRAECYAFSPQYGMHVVSDYATTALYKLDESVYDDDGDAITRLRASPHGGNSLKNIFYKSFQLDMETGIGLVSGQGSDPQVMLQWSDDGGHTWSDETWTSAGGQAGGIGDYLKRVIWRRLGRSRDRVWRVKITDPVPITLLGAEVDFEIGSS